MDVTTPPTGRKARFPDRPPTAGQVRALHRSGHGAIHDAIFKKTPDVADLKRAGRDVAKDMPEVGGMPLWMKMLPDHGAPRGNVNLIDEEFVARPTEPGPRATDHTTGAFGKFARQVGSAVDGAAPRARGAYEKQCYADI
jgi:hypothetical protein